MAESGGDRLFQERAAGWLAEPDIERGTIMRFPCLRVGGEFAAASHHLDGGLIVKLPAERVAGLIEDGVAVPFAPAGRPFREWAHVTLDEPELWDELIGEAVSFARNS
jgi:hypothetical protein